MAEVKFLLKCLVLTVVLLVAMQIHWGEQTVEYRFEHWMKNSKVTQFLEKSSEGGGLFIQRTYRDVERKLRNSGSSSDDQRGTASVGSPKRRAVDEQEPGTDDAPRAVTVPHDT